ncbi:MAG: rhomboid family intramembrane serine protease [Culturomica sp.]|jgi:membrane associated rhomboid family serine protease|nr:rhomboid family intramembrane serine protease [Culturomica sp.]
MFLTYIIIAVTAVVSYICFHNRTWMDRLSLNPYRVVHRGEWYRLLAHGFVHADTMHLFVNMFTFWSFGIYMEQAFPYIGFGAWAYPLLYFGGMVAASLYDVIRRRNDQHYSSIGASGAVASVLFCAIFLNPAEKILLFAVLPVPGIVFGVLYLIYCQYMAKRGGGNINHNAHFYGALYGFVFPILLDPSLLSRFFENLRGFGF